MKTLTLPRPLWWLLLAPVYVLCVAAAPAPDRFARLLPAIEFVESGGRSDAVGDGGRAVGVLQIHPVMVAECNRIVGRAEFTLADRLSPARSREMFRVYVSRHARGASDEVVSRRWNGGPKGDAKAATLPYWRKVSSRMESSQ